MLNLVYSYLYMTVCIVVKREKNRKSDLDLDHAQFGKAGKLYKT